MWRGSVRDLWRLVSESPVINNTTLPAGKLRYINKHEEMAGEAF